MMSKKLPGEIVKGWFSGRIICAAVLAAVLLITLAACTIQPPQYISPVIAPTIRPEDDPTATPLPLPTDVPDTETEPGTTPRETNEQGLTAPSLEPSGQGAMVVVDVIGPTAAPEGTAVSDEPDVTAEPAPTDEPPRQALLGRSPFVANVEIFYPGMASMMGFVDSPIATIYENTMEAIAASVSLRYPNAAVSMYRYSLDIGKENMKLPRETLLASISDPSFFRDTPMREQPPRIKPEDRPLRIQAEKMNEPVASFYETQGVGAPAALSPASGTVVALTESDPGALTLVVTDLHELRIDDGTLISALSHNALSTGRSIGMLALTSEFAGYVPEVGANKTAFVWGAPPTGTLDYTLDFTDYKVGVSIDPQRREVKPRPFYVICLGEQNAVSDTMQTLTDRLSREFASNGMFKISAALYGSDYVPEGYAMSGHMKYVQGQGVTAMPDAMSNVGISRVELKASNQPRFLEWEIEYPAHPADPRSGKFADSDFIFEARIAGVTQGKSLTELTWTVSEAGPGNVRVKLRLEFPQGFIERGEYNLTITGALAAPSDMPGMEWAEEFGWDPEGAQMLEIEQNVKPFRGDRTLYLSRLLQALGQAHIARVGDAPLGSVEFSFIVIG